MTDEGESSNEGRLHSISHLLQLPEAASQKEVVLCIVKAARSQPAAMIPLLVVMLQQDEASAWQKVAIYRSLQAMMEHGLEVEPAGQFILAASKHLRASPDQEVPRELQAAASSTLATFACHHFHPIMMELQHQLKPFAPPDEFTLLTLGKIAANNVYSCVPFLGITLTTLQTAMRRIEDGRRRRALCTALEQMCGAIRIYLRTWERSSYPRISVQQFSAYLLPLYSCMTRTWLPGCDAQVQLAVLKTLSPILRLLLPRTDFQAHIYSDISLLLAQYDSSTETFLVTKILGQILEASLVNNNPIPREHVGPLTCALVRQICIRGQKWPPHPQCEENFKEIARIFLRLARLHPSGLMGVFQGKVEERQEDVCAVLLALFSEIVGAQLPELWSRRQLCVRVVKAALGDDSTRVRRRRDLRQPAAGPGTQSSMFDVESCAVGGTGPPNTLKCLVVHLCPSRVAWDIVFPCPLWLSGPPGHAPGHWEASAHQLPGENRRLASELHLPADGCVCPPAGESAQGRCPALKWPGDFRSVGRGVGGHLRSLFLFQTHPTLSLPLGGLEEKAIGIASAEVLHIAVASGRGTSQELWTKLLSYLMQPPYMALVTPLCHALRLLAEQRLRRVGHKQNGLGTGGLPTPQELMARLLALAVFPLEGTGRGAAVLLLMNALRPEAYRDVGEHWWVEIPALVRYLEGHSKYTLEPAAWEAKLLEFLQKSLRRSEAGGWNLVLGKELSKQLSTYHNSSAEKGFLYKALGMALSAAGDADGVAQTLLDLLLHTDYTEEAQRKGVCWCVVYCAEGQLTAVLQTLSRFEEVISEGEDSAYHHFGQSLPEPGRGSVKSALLLLYGSMAVRAPREQLLALLASEIVPRILRHYTSSGPELTYFAELGCPTGRKKGATDAELALSFSQCVSEISLSILSKGDAPTFCLPQKRLLLDHLVDIIKAEPLDALVSPVRQQVMVALRHLSHVPEQLSREENQALAEAALSSVFALPPLGLAEDAGQAPLPSSVHALHTGALTSLSELVETLLEEEVVRVEQRESANLQWFQQAFQLLGYWMVSEREWERARALQLGVHLLRAHCQKTSASPRIPPEQFSRLAGALGPFTCDVLGSIRQGAVDCIRVLLSTQGTQRPRGRLVAWQLHCIQRKLRSESSPREVRTASLQLAKVVSRALPPQEILAFLHTLLEQLRAVSPTCDQAVLLWFEVVVKEQRAALKDKIPDLVAVICSYVQQSEDATQRHCLAQAVCVLTERHCRAVCATLLQQALLPDRARMELLVAVATHKDNSEPVLRHLLNVVRGEGRGTPSYVMALVSLREGVLAPEGCSSQLPLLSKLCHALLCQLSSTDLNTEIPDPSSLKRMTCSRMVPLEPRRQAVLVLQAVLSRALPESAGEMDVSGDTWSFLMQPGSYLKGVALLARSMAWSQNPLIDDLLRHLLPHLSSSRTAYRDLSLVFCMEIPGHSLLHTPEMLALLLQEMLARSQDGSTTLRALALRGLGNVATEAPHEVKKHQESLLATLLQAAGNGASPEVACESLCALGKLWGCIGRRHRVRALQAVAGLARGHLWHVDDSLREAAFELLGQLARATQPEEAKSFAKEVGRSLTALLLHFREPSPTVAKACSIAFTSCAPFVGLQDLTGDMEAGQLLADVSGARHIHLMGKVCRQLAKMNPVLLGAILADVPQYLCCTWEGVQIAACKLAGILVKTADAQRLRQLDLDRLLVALRPLCRDPNAAVEIAASEALHATQQKCQQSQASSARSRRRRPLLPSWLFGRQRKGPRPESRGAGPT
ncbi:maestro heat-like repeat-containing protein family member 2A isoform X3 [Podarcis raffonei]|uniref:maestro heat-like repeat-containing protein family member 2A isoform X3 n=1 Tax=Podarcis raffonei TaxID=65483 RepID=UPI0023292D7A|nr:maestro heat-like repeat-containing protein family member 2A isoform X3 [Podarcis raffonei]